MTKTDVKHNALEQLFKSFIHFFLATFLILDILGFLEGIFQPHWYGKNKNDACVWLTKSTIGQYTLPSSTI